MSFTSKTPMLARSRYNAHEMVEISWRLLMWLGYVRGHHNVLSLTGAAWLQSVTIGHDNRGYGPSWHLDHLIVTNLRSGVQSVISGRCWFAQGYEDGLIERQIPVSQTLDANTEFVISAVTGDVRYVPNNATITRPADACVLHKVQLPSVHPRDFHKKWLSAFFCPSPIC